MPKTKQLKREEAEERRLAYLQRDAEEQLELVRQRPGESRREVERLLDCGGDTGVIAKIAHGRKTPTTKKKVKA